MKMIRDRFTRFCCAVIAAASMQAFGTVITTTYSDRAVWTSAATNLQMITFEGLVTPPAGSQGYNSGLKFPDIATFMGYMAADMPELAVVDPGTTQTWYDWSSGASLLGPTNYRSSALAFLPYIHIVFVTPVKAFGVDLMSINPNELKYKIVLDGTIVFQDIATYPRPTRAFWGVISDTSFTTVDLSLPEYPLARDARALIDNVAFGDTAPLGPPPEDVPEACTLLLIGSGLVTMVAVQRRVRRKCRVA